MNNTEDEINLEELTDDIEDFDFDENLMKYSIALEGTNNDGTPVFEQELDSGYTYLEEAKKCFDYTKEHFSELNIKVPDTVKTLTVYLLATEEEGPTGEEFSEVVDSAEIIF